MEGDDPESLYTGVSSAQFVDEELNEKAQEEIQRQKRERNTMAPFAQSLLEFIDKERADVKSLEMMELDKVENPQQMLDELRARKTYLGFLQRMETWITLRMAKQPKAPAKRLK